MLKSFPDVSGLPGFSLVKNTRFELVSLTKTVAQLCGWKKPEDGIGKYDHDAPCKVSEIAEQFIALDKAVIKSVNKLISFDIAQYVDGWNIFVVERTPIINDLGVVGWVHSHGLNVTNCAPFAPYLALYRQDVKRFGHKDKQKVYVLGFPELPKALTKKEEVCLFLLIRGKTTKEIAKIECLSPRTIEDRLNNIKTKMNCISKSELIDKAINSGYLCYLPINESPVRGQAWV